MPGRRQRALGGRGRTGCRPDDRLRRRDDGLLAGRGRLRGRLGRRFRCRRRRRARGRTRAGGHERGGGRGRCQGRDRWRRRPGGRRQGGCGGLDRSRRDGRPDEDDAEGQGHDGQDEAARSVAHGASTVGSCRPPAQHVFAGSGRWRVLRVTPGSRSGAGPLVALLTLTYVAGPGHDHERPRDQRSGAIRAAARAAPSVSTGRESTGRSISAAIASAMTSGGESS